MEDVDKAINVRRAAKRTYTRSINGLKELMSQSRPVNEVTDVFQSLKNAYKALEVKHDEFTMLLDDKDFDEAEEWMQNCNSQYIHYSVLFNDYVNANTKNNEGNMMEQPKVDAVTVESSVDDENVNDENVSSQDVESQSSSDQSESDDAADR